MTCYLGPDNPPPLSLISEIHQRSLQVSKVSTVDDNLFDFGDMYYSRLCKLLRLQAGINIDDKICVVCSRRSRIPLELERRLCLIYPVMRLTFGRALYESLDDDRDMKVQILPIDAEDFFGKEGPHILFDKVIIMDGLELIENIDTFLTNVKGFLKKSSDSSVIVFHRTKEMTTLPLYLEAIDDLERKQIEVDEIFLDFTRNDFLVSWNIVSLPIHIPKEKYLNQLFNHFPPIMENLNTTDIYGGLRELAETSFKYSEYYVMMKDKFLFIIASPSASNFSIPYKMFLLDEDIESFSSPSGSYYSDRLLRLNITSDIQRFLPKDMSTLRPFLDEDDEYPEEWWGTMANVPMVGLDKSRVNRYIQRRHIK